MNTHLRMRLAALRATLDTSFPVRNALPRWLVWALIAAAYVPVFGWPTVVAVQHFFDPDRPPRGDISGSQFARSLIETVGCCSLVLAVTVLVVRHVAPDARIRWCGARREASAGWAFLLGLLLGQGLMLVIDAPSPPRGENLNSWATVDIWISGLTAGLVEEPLLALMVPLVLRAAGYRWRTVLVVVAVLRVAFHLYYGPAAFGLAVWAVVAAVVACSTGCLWGLVLAHALRNLIALTASLSDPMWRTIAEVVYALVILGALWRGGLALRDIWGGKVRP